MVPRNRSPVGAVVEPARHHHLVVAGGDRGAEVAVGHDAARHRVQDRDVDAALVEQVPADDLGVRTGVLAVRPLGAVGVLAAGGAVPVHLVVGEAAAAVRLAHEVLAQVLVRLDEDVHARIDDGRRRSVRMLDH